MVWLLVQKIIQPNIAIEYTGRVASQSAIILCPLMCMFISIKFMCIQKRKKKCESFGQQIKTLNGDSQDLRNECFVFIIYFYKKRTNKCLALENYY